MQLHGRELIGVTPEALPPLNASPEDLPVEILYEDDAVIAVNKPAGLVVHAGAGAHSGTLVNRLVHHFASLSTSRRRSAAGHRASPGSRNQRSHAGRANGCRASRAGGAVRGADRGENISGVGRGPGRARNPAASPSPITRDPVHRTRMTARLRPWTRGAHGISRAASASRNSRISKCASAPGARIRSARIWRASAIRSPAIDCMGRGQFRHCPSAFSSTPGGSRFRSPATGGRSGHGRGSAAGRTRALARRIFPTVPSEPL